jgi:thiamine pyrophosphokinase
LVSPKQNPYVAGVGQAGVSPARIMIFANGLLPDVERARRLIEPDDMVICADGGTRHALDLGLAPALIVGDLDSLDLKDRAQLAAADAPLRSYSKDKDETDLELAVREALTRSPSSIVIVGALGSRLDHTLGNISILSDPALLAVDCRLDDGIEEAFFCRDRSRVRGEAGDVVSLVPWGIAVTGVHTEGLRWPLRGETLHPYRTRGISNEMLSDVADVDIETGLLLIVHRRTT